MPSWNGTGPWMALHRTVPDAGMHGRYERRARIGRRNEYWESSCIFRRSPEE